MRKKLTLLNLLLVGALVWIGRELMEMRRAAVVRQQNELGRKMNPVPAPPATAVAMAMPLQAAGYLDVAQQTLFSKDRNPNIVVEPEKPKIPPPFPRFYGVMNLGDGLMAILSDGPGRQKPFNAGDKTGELVLAEIGTDTLVFEWEKQKLTKKFSELQEKVAEAAPVAAQAGPVVNTPSPQAIAANSPRVPEPGADVGGGMAACNANDSSPAGTIANGKKKVMTDSPFGKVCRWEPVK